MYQGDTITTTVDNLPVPVSEIANVYIIFKDHDRILIEKTLKDCVVSEETISNRLTQEESLSLPEGTIDRTIIVITKDGSRFETDPCPILCGKTAKSEVLT